MLLKHYANGATLIRDTTVFQFLEKKALFLPMVALVGEDF